MSLPTRRPLKRAFACVVSKAAVSSSVTRNIGTPAACFAGYIMDRRVGNTQKMGALFGILAAIGVEIPQPGK